MALLRHLTAEELAGSRARFGLRRSVVDHHAAVSSEMTQQLHLTEQLVDVRLGMGDNPTVAREVDHHARFRRMADARAAASALITAGYDAETSRRMFRPLLEASHVTAVDHRTAAAFTREVLSIVEQYGGEYGGWGAMIVEGNG